MTGPYSHVTKSLWPVPWGEGHVYGQVGALDGGAPCRMSNFKN